VADPGKNGATERDVTKMPATYQHVRGAALTPNLPTARRSRLPVHLEDAEWSRLALGTSAQVLASLGTRAGAEVLLLDPDSITVHLPTPQMPRWPFNTGQSARSWTLPRDSRLLASLPVTPEITGAARGAGLVTLSEIDGRRALVDLVAVGSTLLKGPPAAVGVKIAEVAVELGSRRWSDLETLVLVAFDGPMPRLEGTRHAPDVAAALDEVTVRSMTGAGSTSICVIVPPWASDPADPLLGELVRFCERTSGVGVLCCESAEGALCLWELACEAKGLPSLTFGDGRVITGPEIAKPGTRTAELPPSHSLVESGLNGPGQELADPQQRSVKSAHQHANAQTRSTAPVEVSVLGNVQVNGAPESFRYRRRLTELVAFLAMHPQGATSDAFATALWPERRVPLQTLANRLSETRRALGLASDGRPRLRKQGRRHLIVEAETDWDRFKDLASEGHGPDSWRRALTLVRGRPFDGLDRGEWAQLEGHSAVIESSVVSVACRLGEHALDRGEAGLAHWAALQGLLVSPWDERLYRLLMRAADALGNRGGVDAALRSLALALELEGDPLLGVHPETSALYRSLTIRSLA
jgi:DNA-binding SARP family transcriptional activator